MKTIFNQQKHFFIFLFLLFSYCSYGQKLIDSRQNSFYTYIYKLSDSEANKIYKKGIWKVDTTYFHTLIDSFQTDSGYHGSLPVGHYLKTFAEKNKQKFSVTTVQDFDVFIFNNNTDLCIQVLDLKGNPIRNAEVVVRWKKLHFDKSTQSYLDKKSNQKGLLKVTHDGFTAYYDLSRQFNNSFIKRGVRKIAYETPVKYIWIPVTFVISIPIDGVKSIAKGWSLGSIYRTKKFFINSFKKISCLLDKQNCDYNSGLKFRYKHSGYLVFNKPRYMPGDTVKFKAFVVNKKGKPIDKNVRVVLQTNRKEIELTKLKPYCKGGYKYNFYLHDSLHLILDNSYTIRLKTAGQKEYMSNTFIYEEYELAKTKLSLRVDNNEHFRNGKIRLYAKGTDENDLNLLDARIEVLLTPNSIRKYFENRVFVPDTLLFLKKKLNTAGETEIVISDSTYRKINFDYTITAKLLTSDNEAFTKSQNITYYYESEKFKSELKSDSINFEYLKNGIPVHKMVKIFAVDNFHHKELAYNGLAPCSIKLNPYFSSYVIQSDSASEEIEIADETSLLQCYSERNKDSVYIVVDNPRKIPFMYSVYKDNHQQSSGYTDSLNFRRKSSARRDYFISIRYLWGGKVKEENYRIPFPDNMLKISVTQPKIVYPGQKSRIELLVTDSRGKPVKGVDLTAYSVTKKFDYHAPVLPNPGKNMKNKRLINHFKFEDFNLDFKTGLKLNYDAWKVLAGIDSIEYYKFIYPQNTIYRFDYATQDSITQFAPFVVSKGEILPIHVVYADNKPVYFSWSANAQPYSFRIDSGYHQIKLRTTFSEIILDSIYFSKGKKLIFSLNENLAGKNIKTTKVGLRLSEAEKRVIYKYIVPYKNNFDERFAYLEQDGNIQLLKNKTKIQNNRLTGPFSGYLNFQMVDSFATNFIHEPFFEYEFLPGLLKMRQMDVKTYPDYLGNTIANHNLSDTVYTRGKIEKEWKTFLDATRYRTARYNYPNSTGAGSGKLLIGLKKDSQTEKEIPLNILVFRYDNHEFMRIYPGNTSLIHELQKGFHKIIFFYPGAKYHIEDSVYIRPDGMNYYEFTEPQQLKKDSFSISVSKLIEETLFKPKPNYANEEKELKQIYNVYQQQFKYAGNGNTIEGYVKDELTGEPIPGVSVIIKGTTYGTVTDLNGYYSIKLPPGKNDLNFSFIGFVPQDKRVNYNNIINVNLKQDENKLDEVVVVAFGVEQKSRMAASVVTHISGIPGVSGNISEILQGKTAGVEIITNQGVEIKIRGTTTLKTENTPLYIINGSVYNGDISELDPSFIRNIEILKDSNALAIYGERGANGVVIIETQPGAFKSTLNLQKGAQYDEAFLEAASQSGTIRHNFSDYAFWQPSLQTDKNGKTGFDVVFPDDITNWETFFLAMNGKRQAGQSSGQIKSYKPLMAQLALPAFMVHGDTSFAIGKTLNYMPDSMKVKTNFVVNGQENPTKERMIKDALIDTLSVTASADTLNLKYYIETNDNYFDGEQRNIPVYPEGIEATKGSFFVLDKDTTVKLQFDPSLGTVSLYAKADILEVIEDEIGWLTNYKYLCNEQIASKLKALLAEKNIAYFKGKDFRKDNEVEKLIRLLQKNQKKNGLWGWWKDSEESLWISLHVLEAITHAGQLGYNNAINMRQITELLIWELESSRDFNNRVRILKILYLLNSKVNFKSYISLLEKSNNIPLNGLLQLIELKQLCNISCKTDTLEFYKKTSLFGNIYYSDENQPANLLNNDIQNTLLAYKILKADTLTDKQNLKKIQNYLLENRRNGCWRNTYESALIIETLLPDLLKDKACLTKPVITFKGDLEKTVTDFPFEMQLNPSQKIELSKTGDFPVYFTSYQKFWDKTPKCKEEDFAISTGFETRQSILTTGKGVKLITKITVKKDAEYVMINIPIPGGCSYADKMRNYKNETYREYYKNETTIFCDFLRRGEYSFEINLNTRYSGTYTINPAKVELMYFPTFNANNELKKIKIQ